MTWSSRLLATTITTILSVAIVAIACIANVTAMTDRALAAAIELHGAGATFPAPLYKAWIRDFGKAHPDISIDYDVVGSGEGVARFLAGTVDFGASDVPLPAAEAEKIGRGVVQFPATAGMIVLAYNLPGVRGQLKLPRDVYVDIFLGKVQKWNDPRIQAANTELDLPSTSIAVIGRQDSSGTTHAFSEHLAAVSKAWSESGPGVGKLVLWPRVAMLVRGNEGVASRIKISAGAIGYVEHGFAQRLGLPVASLENKEGKFVAPTPEAGAAAISTSAHLGLENLAASVFDPSGAEAYPIVTYSWLMLLRSYSANQGRALRSFIDFGLGEGQRISTDMGYVPLPPAVADLGKAVVAHVIPGEISAAPPSAGATKPTGASDAAPQSPAAPAPATPSAGATKLTGASDAVPQSPAAPAPATPSRIETYRVAAGDTFKSIAIKLYRDAKRWRDIAAANPELDPRRRLRAGQILKLPEPVEKADHAP